jgi:signal peptidase II
MKNVITAPKLNYRKLKYPKLKYFGVSFLVCLLDQLTKFAVVKTLVPYESIRVTSFFNLVNVRNVGAAFGSFRGLGNDIFIGIAAAAVVVIFVLMIKSGGDEINAGRLTPLAYSLLLGGAAGNLIDRFLRGYVVDFLDFHTDGLCLAGGLSWAAGYHWPAFNAADSALTVGIFVMILGQFKR